MYAKTENVQHKMRMRIRTKLIISLILGLLLLNFNGSLAPSGLAAEQPDGNSDLVIKECDFTQQAGLVFCDDFEQDRLSQYYDYFERWGRWHRGTSRGIGGSYSMNSFYGFYEGDTTGGASTPPHETYLKLGFGKTPAAKYNPVGDQNAVERDLYFRFYVQNHTLAEGEYTLGAGKLATISGYGDGDVPFMNVNVSYPDETGTLKSELQISQFGVDGNPTGVGTVATLKGTKPVMSQAEAGLWHQIQIHVKLNDAGENNGIYELWVDGELENSQYDLDWVGPYTEYGVNSVGLYNMNNQNPDDGIGVPGNDDEYHAFDNLMIAREKIGNAGSLSPDNALLRDLKTAGGKLSPSFSSNQLNYKLQVDEREDNVFVTPTVADERATIRVDGEVVDNNMPIAFDMTQAHPKLTIEVTSFDGSKTNAYTITGVYLKFNVKECDQSHADWIFCDDFESDRMSKYFEHTNPGQFYRSNDAGLGGSSGMKAEFKAANGDQFDTGALKLAFGRTPDSYLKPVGAEREDLREIYFRFYVMRDGDWEGGGGDKLARLSSMQTANWAQSMIAHLWSGSNGTENYLIAEPASGIDIKWPDGDNKSLKTTKWNDWDNLFWFGGEVSQTPIYDANHVGKWYSIEAHIKLDDPGQSNGIFEVWIDDELEMSRHDLYWNSEYEIGPDKGYGLNWFALENYWNAGTPKDQNRYFDNLVISRSKIGLALIPDEDTTAGAEASLTGPESTPAGQTFDLFAGLHDLPNNIYATGMTVNYNPDQVEFVSAQSQQAELAVFVEATDPGIVKLLGGSAGKNATITDSDQLIKLTFKAKSIAEALTSVVTLSDVIISDAVTEIEAIGASHTVHIVPPVETPIDIEGMLQSIADYAKSGQIQSPLTNQLSNRLNQAAHHFGSGRTEQAIKMMNDFIKHLENDAHRTRITPEAKQTLRMDAEQLIQSWQVG